MCIFSTPNSEYATSGSLPSQHLIPYKLIEHASLFHQLAVRPRFRKDSFVKHHDTVAVPHRGKPVSNHNARCVHLGNVGTYFCLRLIIQSTKYMSLLEAKVKECFDVEAL